MWVPETLRTRPSKARLLQTRATSGVQIMSGAGCGFDSAGAGCGFVSSKSKGLVLRRRRLRVFDRQEPLLQRATARKILHWHQSKAPCRQLRNFTRPLIVGINTLLMRNG